MGTKQKRIEALERAARAAQAQHRTDQAEQQQHILQLQQQLLSQERQASHAQAGSTNSSSSRMPATPRPNKHLASPDLSVLSISSLQELLYAAQCQLVEQAEQIARLQQEANVADTQLEKLSNLLQAQEAHAQWLELQLDSKTDAAKSRFAKVSIQLGVMLDA